jgi:hypothetical protein
MPPTRQSQQQQQSALSRLPPFPGCGKTMRLVGRESRSIFTLAEVLTFECECGHLTTATTGQ